MRPRIWRRWAPVKLLSASCKVNYRACWTSRPPVVSSRCWRHFGLRLQAASQALERVEVLVAFVEAAEFRGQNGRLQTIECVVSQPSITGNGRDRIWVIVKLPAERGWRLGRLQVGSTGGWIGFEVEKGTGQRRSRKGRRGTQFQGAGLGRAAFPRCATDSVR